MCGANSGQPFIAGARHDIPVMRYFACPLTCRNTSPRVRLNGHEWLWPPQVAVYAERSFGVRVVRSLLWVVGTRRGSRAGVRRSRRGETTPTVVPWGLPFTRLLVA